MDKKLFFCGGIVVVIGASIYLFSEAEQQRKYRQAFHDGVASGGKEALRYFVNKGAVHLFKMLMPA